VLLGYQQGSASSLGKNLNLRPSGYELDELPYCSTVHPSPTFAFVLQPPRFTGRATDGARTRILLSSATFRCHPLQYLLVRPVIGLICRYYGVFGDSEDYLCPPRSGSYQPGCSKVAVIGPPAGYGKSALMEYDKGTGRGAGWSLVSPWFLLLAATSARPGS
jgi:hypothetical protein